MSFPTDLARALTPSDYDRLDPRLQRALRCLEGAANAGPRMTDEHRDACYEALQQAGYPLGKPLDCAPQREPTRGAGTPGEFGRPGNAW